MIFPHPLHFPEVINLLICLIELIEISSYHPKVRCDFIIVLTRSTDGFSREGRQYRDGVGGVVLIVPLEEWTIY
jgi:hypothetical protein